MVTLTDTSADGKLDARYLSDRRGVLLRAKFQGSPLYAFDFEPFGSEIFGDAIVAPSVRSSSVAHSNSGTTTAITLPAGWQAGDLCYIFCSVLASTPAITTPSGWTAKVSAFVSGQNANLMHAVFRRILQAGDSGPTITRASGRFAAVAVAIYDYDPADPDGTTPTKDTNSGVSGSSVRAPSITSSKDSSMLITAHCVRNGTSGNQSMTFTPPPGMTEIAEDDSDSGSTNTAIEVNRLALGSAGATGTKTATLAGTKITDVQRVGSAILVRPKVVPATSFAGGFAWKNIGGRGTQSMNYNPPGTLPSALQYCATMIKSNGTPCTVDSSLSQVVSEIGIPAVPATLPLIRGSNKYSSGTGSDTTSTVPLPSGWQAGDLCYLIYNVRGTTVTTTVPSGWSALVPETSYQGVSNNYTFGVMKRVLQAGDSNPAIAHTSGRFSAVTVAIQAGTFDSTTPEDVTPTTSTATAGVITQVPSPSITPVTDQCLILTNHLASNNTTVVTMTFTPPSGMTELQDTTSGHTSSGNTSMETCYLQRGTGTNGVATGIKNATPTSTDLTNVAVAGVTIAVRPKDQGTPAVPGVSGSATSPAFNLPSSPNTLVVAMASYNAASGDAAGDKITITNNKGLTVVPGVSRDHRDGSQNGGTKIAYMWGASAQTGMTVTATLSGVTASVDDIVLKILLIGNVDWAELSPDGTLEGSSQSNSKTISMQSEAIEEGVALWVIMDGVTKGTPVITEPTWTAISPSTVSKTSSSPINGQQSLLNSWTSGGQGISYTLPSSVSGEQCVRIWFKIKGSEGLSSAWTSSVGARLEVKAYNLAGYNWQTNTLGFPGNVERYWYTDFFIPKGNNLKKITITGYGWDSNANARFDDIKIETVPPDYIRFVRKTDGGNVRGGDPAQAVLGTAYAFDDELTPNQDTEWYAEPIYYGQVGSPTGTVNFVIEDRSVDLPSTMIKSVETPGLIMFLPVDQKDFTRQRSTTFVNKQSTGKPAGGVNSAYSASGDYMLITSTIAEMNDLLTILDEAVLYLSPTGRYNRKPFYATVSEYTILDFARMDGQEKIFNIQFQEVERPDTEGQPNYLPLRDYAWLQTQYANYAALEATGITYDDLAFSAVD